MINHTDHRATVQTRLTPFARLRLAASDVRHRLRIGQTVDRRRIIRVASLALACLLTGGRR